MQIFSNRDYLFICSIKLIPLFRGYTHCSRTDGA